MKPGGNPMSVYSAVLVCATLIPVCSFLTPQAQPTKFSLEGRWRVMSDKWRPLIVTFGPGSIIKLESDGEAVEGTYKVNFEEKPAHLDIKWPGADEAKTIIEIIGENEIRIENWETYPERPKGFSEQAITLERVKR